MFIKKKLFSLSIIALSIVLIAGCTSADGDQLEDERTTEDQDLLDETQDQANEQEGTEGEMVK